MNSRLKWEVSLAIAAAGILAATPGHAQSAKFSQTGLSDYALLNGNYLALYVDRFGDLGVRAADGTKPGGALRPGINTDGSLNIPLINGKIDPNYGTDAALFSKNRQSTNLPTVGASVSAKDELITVGLPTEGFSVHAQTNTGQGWNPYYNFAPVSNGFSVTGNSINNTLTATSALNLGALNLTQTITFNDASKKNIVKFFTQFTNTGTTAITGLQYVRAFDPLGSVNTTQGFGTDTQQGAFAINSFSKDHQVGFGVLPTDPNSIFTTVFATGQAVQEGSLLSLNPNNLAANENHVVLNGKSGGTYGATYTDVNDANHEYDASDYTTRQFFDTQDPSADPIAPDLSTIGSDSALVLLSPLLVQDGGGVAGQLDPGKTASFTFYYYFDTIIPDNGGSVPEPGSFALLIGGAVSGGGLLLRARRKQK